MLHRHSQPAATRRARISTLALALALAFLLVAHLPATTLAQKETKEHDGSHASSSAHHADPSSSSSSKPKEDDKAATTSAASNTTTTIITPLAPVDIPTFTQCEPALLNASLSANPALNAHDLSIRVSLPNGTEYFTETVKGSGKNASPTPFVWTWTAVDLEAGSQFVLSLNQTSGKKPSKKDDGKTPHELVLLPPTSYTVAPSSTNQTACLQEAADTNHKGRRHRAAQRGANEVKIIGSVIGSFLGLLLLLIGLMAYRRRREAKRLAASGVQQDYDDFEDFDERGNRSTAMRGASSLSLRNVGSNQGVSNGGGNNGGTGIGGGLAQAEEQQPQRRNMQRAAGYKYMSRMVGGLLEPEPSSSHSSAELAPSASHAANLYRPSPHEYGGGGYGYGITAAPATAGSAGMRRIESDESAEMDPFANRQRIAGRGHHANSPSLTTALPSPGTGARERRGSQQQDPSLAAHLLPHHNDGDDDDDDDDDEEAIGARRKEPLPTYRESSAGRKKRSNATAAGANKSRLGADGRVQEGVVVSVRPPRYQDEWRASLGEGQGQGQGSPQPYEGGSAGQSTMAWQGQGQSQQGQGQGR
ncbi:unnamed protein product [Tilletia caries]|nr:unnamed protein product [Tilletia caries]